MTYHEFVTYRLLDNIATTALEKIKKGSGALSKEGIPQPGLNKVASVLVNQFGEVSDLDFVSLDELPQSELSEFVPIKTERGFYVMDTGKEYTVFKIRENKEFLSPQEYQELQKLKEDKEGEGSFQIEDEKYFRKLAINSTAILNSPETASERELELIEKMKKFDAISYKTVAAADFITMVFQALKANPTLKGMFEEETGQKMTKKNISLFAFEDLKHISEEVLTLNIYTPYFKQGGYTPISTSIIRGHPTIDELKSSIHSSVEDPIEKKTLLELIENVVSLCEEGVNIEVLNSVGLDYDAYAQKEFVFTALKKITDPISKDLKNVEKEDFLAKNEEFLFFEQSFSLKFECKENTPEKYLTPTLSLTNLLNNAEEIGFEHKDSATVVNYGGKENLFDVKRTIKSLIEILSGENEQKKAINDIKNTNTQASKQSISR